MQFSFTCPIEGCGQKMTVDATSREEATEKLTDVAKGHVVSVHPDFHKTDDEVRGDITSMMAEESDEPEGGGSNENPTGTTRT